MPKTCCNLSAQTLLELSRMEGGIGLPHRSDLPCWRTPGVEYPDLSLQCNPLSHPFSHGICNLICVTQLPYRLFVLEVCHLSFFFFFLEQFSKLPSSVSNSYLFFPPSIFVAAPVLVVFVKIRKITFFCYPVVNENIAKYWPQDKSLCNFSS